MRFYLHSIFVSPEFNCVEPFVVFYEIRQHKPINFGKLLEEAVTKPLEVILGPNCCLKVKNMTHIKCKSQLTESFIVYEIHI